MSRAAVRPLLRALEERLMPDSTPTNLAVNFYYQNWNSANLITTNDNWSAVQSIVGYLGDDTIGVGVNPQTTLTPYSTVNVIANQGSNVALSTGGVAEFDGLADRIVALQPDATADAPNLVISANTTGRSNITISYSLLDLDDTSDNAVQPVALQYRVGNAGNFVNVPSGFVADATSGPNLAVKESIVTVTLPSAVNNQPFVEFRIITANAVGNDEWVGIARIVLGSSDIAVNTYTFSDQQAPAIDVDADGDAMVVWQSTDQDGEFEGIYGQRFTAMGAKVGGEFRVNTYTTFIQQHPSVAVDAAGDAIVVWHSYQDGDGYGVYGQRYNPAGAKVGGEFQVNPTTTGSQKDPSVAMDAGGDSIVAWVSYGQDGWGTGVYAQRFNAAGSKVGAEFRVNTVTTNNQNATAVAMDADGDTVVVWCSKYQDGSDYGIYGQRFDSAGSKVGSEFRVNTYTTNRQSNPSVAVDADGDFAVVWDSDGQDGSGGGIYGQRYNSSGAQVGGEFRINTTTADIQFAPSVAMDADGDILIAWQSLLHIDNTFDYGLFAQRYTSAGATVGIEFPLDSYRYNSQEYPVVAVDVDGDAMVAWQSRGQDGSLEGVYGQRFRSPNPIPVLLNVQENDGTAQRSMVKSLKLTFSSPVSFVGNAAAAFSLINQKTSNAVTLSAAIDLSGTAVTLTFTGGSVDLGGSLSDGRYTLTVLGGQFAGNGFDGNGDGIAGDGYVMVGAPANRLFRLFGDADGNGLVDGMDFAAFRNAFNTNDLTFDFDGSGVVDGLDFGQFRQRFGVVI